MKHTDEIPKPSDLTVGAQFWDVNNGLVTIIAPKRHADGCSYGVIDVEGTYWAGPIAFSSCVVNLRKLV